MRILFDSKRKFLPEVSIILLDWSCRESFHILRYLENQTVSRDYYEVIWVEYYKRQSSEIIDMIESATSAARESPLDKWIVMDMPQDVYYHKHVMLNVGIIVGSGRIITFCDSDAIVSPTFVENIIDSFKTNDNIILHMDEVRNTDRRFYPFAYPAIEEILGIGCINWKNGQTTGLQDSVDPLHSRNYGSCMSATKKNLIEIGGSDEYIDYLGHICGVYEMTFRLMNAGRKELWHQSEFLYHVWHPGTDGRGNYLGPHDGRNISTTALEIVVNRRVMPLAENPSINRLRMNPDSDALSSLLSLAVQKPQIELWRREKSLRKNNSAFAPRFVVRRFWGKIRLYQIILSLLIKQIYNKKKSYGNNSSKADLKSFFSKVQMFFVFIWRMWGNNIYTVNMCHEVLRILISRETKSISIYGANSIAKILYLFTKEMPIKVVAVYDDSAAGSIFCGYKVLHLESVGKSDEKIVIAAFTHTIEHIARLKKMGVPENNIVRLQ